MNRNSENNDRNRKNHYADFDDYGNARTGNRNSLSHYNPDDYQRPSGHYNDEDQRQHERNRISPDARAYGDFSRGTRYGEGGSTYGSGSAYGPSNYGMQGDYGPRGHGNDRNYYDHNEHSRQNYGRSGGMNYSGRMNDDREGSYRGAGYSDTHRDRPNYTNSDPDERGYDRGFDGFGNTGYGSTRYNNRDEDRERSAYSNWGHSRDNHDRSNRQRNDREYGDRNRARDDYDW